MSRLIERIAFVPPYFDHTNPDLFLYRKRLSIQLLPLPDSTGMKTKSNCISYCTSPSPRRETLRDINTNINTNSNTFIEDKSNAKHNFLDIVSFLAVTHTRDTMASGVPRNTILFAHGNAEDIPSAYDYYIHFSKMTSCNVVVFDYLGYGFSSGDRSSRKRDCTERNAYRAVQAVFDHIIGPMGVPRNRVIVLGRSLGSGSAVELARRECAAGLGGLIIYSGLYSALSVVPGGKWLPSLLDCFVNCNKIGGIQNIPILIVHGDKDDVVPYWHGERLAQIARKNNSRVVLLKAEGCGHNDIEVTAPRVFYSAVREFVAGSCFSSVSPRRLDNNNNSKSSKRGKRQLIKTTVCSI
eukprot:Tbor_TRINITY_DN5383_c3_g1::TRINITY_DN5383_c3_g1_i1::g.4025::m.4025